MGGIEVKAQFSVTDEGRIEGIAWPFGSPDRVGDVIEKGAFAGVVPPLPILASHADGDAVGVWDEITETAEGLAVKGRLLVNEVARAKEISRADPRRGAARPVHRLQDAQGAAPQGRGANDHETGIA